MLDAALKGVAQWRAASRVAVRQRLLAEADSAAELASTVAEASTVVEVSTAAVDTGANAL
jgi:hypothetical protein